MVRAASSSAVWKNSTAASAGLRFLAMVQISSFALGLRVRSVRPLAPPFFVHRVTAFFLAGERRRAVSRGVPVFPLVNVGVDGRGVGQARQVPRLREARDRVAQVTAGAAARARGETRAEPASLAALARELVDAPAGGVDDHASPS